MKWLGRLACSGAAAFSPLKLLHIQLSRAAHRQLVCCSCHADDVLSYAELREQTKLPDEDLTRCLASLTLSKYKLLVKVGAWCCADWCTACIAFGGAWSRWPGLVGTLRLQAADQACTRRLVQHGQITAVPRCM